MDTVGFSDVVKTIGDVGIMMVISAVVVYALIRGLKILFSWIEKKTDIRKHDDLMQTRTNVDYVIQDDIDFYLDNHDVHRVQVVEFSNSVASVAYLPFKYASCTYESCDIEQEGRAYAIDKVATSLFTPFLRHLYTQPHIELYDNNMEHVKTYGGAAYDLLRRCKEHHGMFVMMKSNNHKSVGFVAIYKDGDFTEEDISDLETMAIRISGQLCVVDHNNKKAGK